jgi:hypothetical protein
VFLRSVTDALADDTDAGRFGEDTCAARLDRLPLRTDHLHKAIGL